VTADPLSTAIRRLAAHESLDGPTITRAFGAIMRGEGTPAQVAALLMALRVKGESATEVAGVVEALRAAMVELPARDPRALVDTCGTGGGALTTFNISTAAALLAAGMGVRVAKHGNRSFTSRSGSADVLEALGVVIETTPAAMAATLEEAGIVFMFAPLMHPALRHVCPSSPTRSRRWAPRARWWCTASRASTRCPRWGLRACSRYATVRVGSGRSTPRWRDSAACARRISRAPIPPRTRRSSSACCAGTARRPRARRSC
jgi:hypothetical protein